MPKYIPVHFLPGQWKASFYRIYINIFGIFFKIKLVPLRIDKFGIDFWYKGDTVIWILPWKRKNRKERWISMGFSGTGEFGSAYFSSLAEMDKLWNEFMSYEK